MDHRTLSSVVWRQQQATRIELEFDDGRIETVDGTHAEAATLATEAGLRLVHSPLGSVRWTRELPTKDGRAPKRIGPWLSG